MQGPWFAFGMLAGFFVVTARRPGAVASPVLNVTAGAPATPNKVDVKLSPDGRIEV